MRMKNGEVRRWVTQPKPVRKKGVTLKSLVGDVAYRSMDKDERTMMRKHMRSEASKARRRTAKANKPAKVKKARKQREKKGCVTVKEHIRCPKV